MAVTAQQVFDMACVLIDEVTENGTILTDNPNYYRTKSLSILTMLQTELSGETKILTSLSNDVNVDDRTAISVLPYGLAAHLLLTDGDMQTASYFNERYEDLKRKNRAKITQVVDHYRVVEGMS